MTYESFIDSLKSDSPPNVNGLLLALWHDAKGDWETSHNIAQDIHSKDGALIHAYLHRKEGDIWNADYWYRNAGTKRPEETLEIEWITLVTRFINK